MTVYDSAVVVPGVRWLVSVCGAKDSLALWDILVDMDYQADGLYLGLGIGDYSDTSGDLTLAFASERGLHLIEVDLPSDHGFDIPNGSKAAKRVPCAAGGIWKRKIFDEAERNGGYDGEDTGHSREDEAAELVGKGWHWQTD